MSKKLAHAKHNESVCNFITHKQEYADWVIITAFYSAMHFVDHKLFPFNMDTGSGHKYRVKDIDEYKLLSKSLKDKHSVRVQLVKEKCPSISANFFWLYNTCRIARYTSYEFNNPREYANLAKNNLTTIKQFCDDTKS